MFVYRQPSFICTYGRLDKNRRKGAGCTFAATECSGRLFVG
jgi:hydroxymethylpyrimidine/phosphomethylpyrimidine kinase